VTEEGPRLRPPTGLALQRFGLIGANTPGSSEQVGAAINDCKHVLRFSCLRVAVAAQANNGKAHRSQDVPEASRQPGIVEKIRHHGIDGALERVERVDCHGCRQIVPVKHGQPSASAKDSPRFMKGLLRIWQMAQSGVEHDEVKGRIRERNGSTVSGAEGQLWMARC
jgi:hypothetical protein